MPTDSPDTFAAIRADYSAMLARQGRERIAAPAPRVTPEQIQATWSRRKAEQVAMTVAHERSPRPISATTLEDEQQENSKPRECGEQWVRSVNGIRDMVISRCSPHCAHNLNLGDQRSMYQHDREWVGEGRGGMF